MASVFPSGDVIPVTNEYGDDISPFDKSEIDDLIILELQLIRLSDWQMTERWHGIYRLYQTFAEETRWRSVTSGPGPE